MIISRTPFRISLFGGGTDYPAWYMEHGGKVLGTTIDKYCYISVRNLPSFFTHKHRIVYSQVELVQSISEIKHPSVQAVMHEMGIDSGKEIQHAGDLPARSGLGSSSAFTVGLLHALNALEGRMVTAHHLAREAIRIEQQVIKENVGSQDQIWAAFGGFNVIELLRNDDFTVTPIIMQRQRMKALNDNFLLFFTGLSRYAHDVVEEQMANLPSSKTQLQTLGQMVDEALQILQSPNRPFDEIGKLLHESWQIKRTLSNSVSMPTIDAIYETGRKHGALGGKLLGAGGGGFMLFYAPPECHEGVRAELRDLIEVSFAINSQGSKIVLYEPDGLEHK